MKSLMFFKKDTSVNVLNAKGPQYKDQIEAMLHDKYWRILNSNLLSLSSNDEDLCHRVNALKHSLQTYGPEDQENLPDFRHNKGRAQGSVFHGHVNNSTGKTYVLEWAIIDRNKRIMALTNFDVHENFKFKQEPLDQGAIKCILSTAHNLKIIALSSQKIAEVKAKFANFEVKKYTEKGMSSREAGFNC